MARTWLLLLLALECPALPTGVGGTPFPSLAPPITLLVDGKQQMLVVCLVLDVAPPGFESPIWFSASNGSTLDAFTYGPSPAADGTWTSLAQLSLPSEDLAFWETLICHTGPGDGDQSQSTQPLLLSGKLSSARTCLWEPLRGTAGQALRLGALRLLLFKLLLFDLLLTCSRLRAPPAAQGPTAGEPRPLDPGFSAPAPGPQPLRLAEPCAPAGWSPRSERGHRRARAAAGRRRGSHLPSGPGTESSRSPAWEEGALSTRPAGAGCSRPATRILQSRKICVRPASSCSPGIPGGAAVLTFRPRPIGGKRLLVSLPSNRQPLEGGD